MTELEDLQAQVRHWEIKRGSIKQNLDRAESELKRLKRKLSKLQGKNPPRE